MSQPISHFQWRVRQVQSETAEKYAKSLEQTLNDLEAEGFAIDEVERVPGGAIVVGKKPRALPA